MTKSIRDIGGTMLALITPFVVAGAVGVMILPIGVAGFILRRRIRKIR
ncbi:hypothetical protein HY933_03205 [Candidatus Falkowbacteria bacterium]|nr:hypothetical protein [Candidatus Falkowbacteria bacterium]